MALVKVFERILKVDEERGVEERREIGNASEGSGFVVCRLLAPSNQVGSVLGRGGKIVEKIRQDSGARVRVLPRESLPGCASAGDELIQVCSASLFLLYFHVLNAVCWYLHFLGLVLILIRSYDD